MTMVREPNLRKQLEAHLHELPVLPTVVARLMALNPKSETYFDDVRRLIEPEPNFSTRILAAANSAASAPRTPITTLSAAIARIGSMSASNLVLAMAITRVFVPRDAWEKSLWRHALQVALAARVIAQKIHDPDIDGDEAYTCALLHDIGRFVMFQEAPDKLREIDEGDWHTPDALIAMEKTICGLTHSELGAMACALWHLPEVVVDVVRDHHARTGPNPVGKVAKMTALIHCADIAMFPSAMPGTPGLADADDETIKQMLQLTLPAFVRLSANEIHEVLKAVTREAEDVCKLLGVA